MPGSLTETRPDLYLYVSPLKALNNDIHQKWIKTDSLVKVSASAAN